MRGRASKHSPRLTTGEALAIARTHAGPEYGVERLTVVQLRDNGDRLVWIVSEPVMGAGLVVIVADDDATVILQRWYSGRGENSRY